MENENYANPTPTEYFNHLVNNSLVREMVINDNIGRIVVIIIKAENQHKLLMPQESHLKALQQYPIEHILENGEKINTYNVGLSPFIKQRFHRLGLSIIPNSIDSHELVHERHLLYICNLSMRTIEQYRRDVLPYVRFD
ncbi:hypothetical protein ACFX5K_00615 [Rickettsiales bacterium LUAb2]